MLTRLVAKVLEKTLKNVVFSLLVLVELLSRGGTVRAHLHEVTLMFHLDRGGRDGESLEKGLLLLRSHLIQFVQYLFVNVCLLNFLSTHFYN